MKRLLCLTGSMDRGGAETFMMKVYRCLDRTSYQMDFVEGADRPTAYDDEIAGMGGRIFRVPCKTESFFKFFAGLRNVVRTNHYHYVLRLNTHSISVLDMIAAKSGGAKKFVIRSRSTKVGGRGSTFLHCLLRPFANMLSDLKVAPSTESARFTFGKRCLRNGKVLILPNGLDIDAFRFDQKERDIYRKDLGVENKLVIGHVGRLTHAKNHKFLLEVFAEIKKLRNDAVLLLVGKGELEKQIKEQAMRIGLDGAIKFLGVREDIPQLLSAMDGFLFPSFYEGMPNTVIEAQTSGLPCLISDRITPEAGVTDLVHFKSLDEPASAWAKRFLSILTVRPSDRPPFSDQMRLSGYDIESVAKIFVEAVFAD